MGSEFSQVLNFDPGGHRIRCENHQYVIWWEIGPPPKIIENLEFDKKLYFCEMKFKKGQELSMRNYSHGFENSKSILYHGFYPLS